MAFDPNQEFEVVDMGQNQGFDPNQEFEVETEAPGDGYNELIAPDGMTVKVPESQAAKLIREEGYKTKEGLLAEQQTFQDIVAKSKVTPGQSALSGALSSLSYGLGTPASGLYEGVKGLVTGEGSLRGIGQSMKAAGLQEQIEQAKNPMAYLGGALGAGLVMPGYSAAKTAGLAPALLKAGAVGAAESGTGALLRETTDPFDRTAMERAKEVAQATGLGVIAGTAGGVLAKRPEVKEALVEGVKSVPETLKAGYQAFARGAGRTEFPGVIPSSIEGLREVARTLSQRSAAKTLLAADKRKYLEELGQQISTGTEIGQKFVSKKASISDVIKDSVKNYVESKGISIVANELAKAAGSETGINTFEPIKNDIVDYLVKEKGLSEQQAKILVSVLPSNPLEIVGMIPGSTRMNATDKRISKIPEISDEEYILLRATESGPNKVKDLVSRVSSTLFGGRGSESKQLEEVLNIPLEQRVRARSFEPWEGAEAIKPTAMEASEAYKKGAVEQVQKLLPQAGAEFESAGPKVEKLWDDFNTAMEDATILESRHPGIKKFIDDASKIWFSGEDVSSAGLNRGQYNEVDQLQRFMRMQRMRETIDDGIPYDQLKLRDANEGEKVLLGLRSSIDDVLKSSPSKVKSDAIYSEMKNTLKAVFGRTQFKGEVDTGKIEKMLRDTDEAKRFRSHFETLRNWASDETFSPEDRAKMSAFLDKFDDIYQAASQKTKIGKFEWKDGPSSAAVERLGGIVKKDSLTAELFASPKLAIQKMDEFEKNYVNRWTNKNFGDLSLPERLAFIKLRNFMNDTKENVIGFSDQNLMAKYQDFLDQTNKQFANKTPGKTGYFGKFFAGDNIKGNIRDVITDYMYSRGTKFVVEQAVNQAYPEAQASFEQMKNDFKQYLQKQFGLSEGQSELISRILPQNVGEMVPGKTMSKALPEFRLPKLLKKNPKAESEIRQVDRTISEVDQNKISTLKNKLEDLYKKQFALDENIFSKNKSEEYLKLENKILNTKAELNDVTKKYRDKDYTTWKILESSYKKPDDEDTYRRIKHSASQSLQGVHGAVSQRRREIGIGPDEFIGPFSYTEPKGFSSRWKTNKHEGIHHLIAQLNKIVPEGENKFYSLANDIINKNRVNIDLDEFLSSMYKSDAIKSERVSWLDSLLNYGNNKDRDWFIRKQFDNDMDKWKAWSTKAKKAYKEITTVAKELTPTELENANDFKSYDEIFEKYLNQKSSKKPKK